MGKRSWGENWKGKWKGRGPRKVGIDLFEIESYNNNNSNNNSKKME